MKTRLTVLFLLIAFAVFFYFRRPQPRSLPPASVATPKPDTAEIERSLLDQLKKSEPTSRRTLALPSPVPVVRPNPIPAPTVLTPRAEGRKERAALPMGVVLEDNVPAYAEETGGQPIYTLRSGDLLRVLSAGNNRVHIHPGLDVYLAATTKKVEAAGEGLPDKDAWVDKSKITIFSEAQAKEFLFERTPVTLGNDAGFSTLSFYERAMKNPDPVVHRVVGPRLISVVMMHEDYASSWFALYRDADPTIRATTLAALRERGVQNSRPVIEDLIQRLIELTSTSAQGETEVEALAVLAILKAAHHPRVPAALQSLVETWKETQSEKLNQALQDTLK